MNSIRKSISSLRHKFMDDTSRTKDFRSAKRTLLADPAISNVDKALLKKVDLQIHPNDGMYENGDARHYLSVGLSAIHCIEAAIAKLAKNWQAHSILDLPCGYGRVLEIPKGKVSRGRDLCF